MSEIVLDINVSRNEKPFKQSYNINIRWTIVLVFYYLSR